MASYLGVCEEGLDRVTPLGNVTRNNRKETGC